MVIRDAAVGLSPRAGSVAAVAYTCLGLAAAGVLVVAGHLALAAAVLAGVALHLALPDCQR